MFLSELPEVGIVSTKKTWFVKKFVRKYTLNIDMLKNLCKTLNCIEILIKVIITVPKNFKENNVKIIYKNFSMFNKNFEEKIKNFFWF